MKKASRRGPLKTDNFLMEPRGEENLTYKGGASTALEEE